MGRGGRCMGRGGGVWVEGGRCMGRGGDVWVEGEVYG